MAEPDRANWLLRVARGDVMGARAMLEAADAPPRLAAYLAHQAAEKALKASISTIGREPPWIHDLAGLLLLAPDEVRTALANVAFGDFEAARVKGRYPDDESELVDRTRADRLIADAEAIIEAVTAHLGSSTSPPLALEPI